MADSFLSQDEIDRLLNADTESPDDLHGSMGDAGIKPYDPNTQRRVIRERLHSLEIINERFARQFRMGLFNLLRRSSDITAGNIKIQPYHEFARNLPVPTNLNLLHLNPLRGTALMAFSSGLVFMAVDNLFGGDGRFPTKADGREFTPTEQRVIHRMLTMAREAYEFAWGSIYKIKTEYIRSEIQVKFTNITSSPNDVVVTTPFSVEIGSHRGEFNICIPFSTIEPLRELLSNPPMDNSRHEDSEWRSMLASQMRETELELVAQSADINTRLSNVMKMKKGDIIPLDKQEFIEANVGSVPVFTAKYGSVNNQYALKVDRMNQPALKSFNKE
ncbi:TPA: flagellar motor switch protein FliM [Enterobacter hormaechei]|uniref:flagellar motor switch protein FliM n=1 Tax=Enterobacter hormaechei TaxID=158836 RepID=UPI000735BB50|nr:flagellar motor switch protein FliM [Enterobacter hormaechei]KTJ53122.1 flagellar motor switch protein FliM [Enterobacter hormaechei subsp. steigerwaltii]HAV1684969.1 flagellar motor switch protein FliM [Enterobacter hormaechei subsp. steigerwaltii]HCD6304593.1 flagellar motor switch protein FliM [Enterobacter hormaechei]HCD6654659.1 flagellar motor switch protein FliM [Enterobacter hormaechei]HCD8296625.1 flagellar motor switch protein FliM [Enterobacter hormaechei]